METPALEENMFEVEEKYNLGRAIRKAPYSIEAIGLTDLLSYSLRL
jgi:hypothetical protein